jgi:AMP deaminase
LDHLRYQQAEYRISIYGRSKKEWDQLADWIVDHELYSPHNRWLIQVPRLYGMYQSSRSLRTFGEMLDNIFVPLFEVTNDPSSHPKLHLMLQQVVGFDSVDDESKPEEPLFTPDTPADEPDQWTEGNPHYCYYTYDFYANLYVLNQMRAAQGLSSFCFRPHAGEAGELNHLHGAYLTARGIIHGINLRKSPSLKKLY